MIINQKRFGEPGEPALTTEVRLTTEEALDLICKLAVIVRNQPLYGITGARASTSAQAVGEDGRTYAGVLAFNIIPSPK